jgi:hypothetical protein
MVTPRGSESWIENWPAALAALSMPHVGRPLDRHEVDALIEANRDGLCDSARLAALGEWLEPALAAMPGGGFVRLGSRSPKDTALALLTGLKAVDAAGALALLTARSRRVLYDLSMCRDAGYAPWVFVRQWLDIQPLHEFRCFIEGGELAGISACHGQPIELPESFGRRLPVLVSFCGEVASAYRRDAFVADIAADPGGGETPLLIEVNPWGPPTDACLFNWNEPFDGSFRWAGPAGTPHARLLKPQTEHAFGKAGV